jgi:anaerobic magnesium-protoporphyrin IX monomethyl ester cyclase
VRVLLVHTNRERAPQPVMPLGLCLIASALDARGFRPRLLDLCFSRRPGSDVARAVYETKPDVIGLSVRNLDNGEYLSPRNYLPEIVETARACRECSQAPLVIGGPAVSIAPQVMLRLLGADFAVVGEGEQAMPDLAERLAKGQPTSDMPGVLCRNGASSPAPARVCDLDSLSLAEPGRWLDIGRYLRWGSPLPVQSKRGCALKCIHCTYQAIEGTRYRLRSPEAVAQEMRNAARRWGVRRFEFVDSTFNHPPRHALALCEAIVRKPLRADLYTMGLNPAGTSGEMLRLMKRAGFTSVLCTPDSGSDRMLETLRKGFSVEHVARTTAWAQEAGLAILWSFLFGGPGETEQTVRETVRFIETALGPQDRILCTVGLRVYPNTELERVARAHGAIPTDADLVTPVFYCSPHILPARILELLDGSARRSQMLYLQTLQSLTIPWALRLQTALRMRGPLWREVPLYNRLAGWARPPQRHQQAQEAKDSPGQR